MSLPVCEGCGEPLLRKSKFGPPPQRWCSARCRHRVNYYGANEDVADRERWELVARLLDELAPDGLTSECPARRSRSPVA